MGKVVFRLFAVFVILAFIFPIEDKPLTTQAEVHQEVIDDSASIVINEIMFYPEEGEYEWVVWFSRSCCYERLSIQLLVMGF